MSGIRIEHAAELLEKGDSIVFGTDTINGIGCSASDAKAVIKLFEMKKRETGKPFVMLFADMKEVFRYFEYDERVERIAAACMPGGITIVHKPRRKLSALLMKDGYASFRIPARESLLSLISYFGKPLASTSLNLAGEPIITDRKEAQKVFHSYIFNNLTSRTEPSTVIKMHKGRIEMLREGAVKIRSEQWTG